jgi:2-methylcitrate dehydratase PrpD
MFRATWSSGSKLCALDSFGCCLFGATLPWTRKVAELALAEGARPAATLMGMGGRTSASLAALVNGTAGHAFELDDIHKESILHMGSLAIPAALAVAEEEGRLARTRLHYCRDCRLRSRSASRPMRRP